MSIVTEVKQRLQEYETAEVTAGALQDISALRSQAIRRRFDKNREFYEEIRALYAIVQSQAKKASQVPAGETAPKRKEVRQLLVALTSNKRFYGSLIRDIVQELIKQSTQAPDAGTLIVGRVGWQYFEQMARGKRARQMVTADDTPTPQELQSMLQYFESYDRIIVLYPKFINSFRQEVGALDITQSLEGTAESTENVGYIFEPEVPAILAFFDTQVRRVLFDRVLLESELSRTAARLIRMGDAQQRALHLVGSERQQLRRAYAAQSNMELLETFAGFTQWKQD